MNFVDLGKKNILVVEDDIFNRKLIVKFLGKHKNLKLFESHNGSDALDQLHDFNVDLCLLDLYMPQMDGLEMLSYIRQKEKYKDLPIIVITSDEIERKKSLALGANSFIPKPINLKELELEVYKSLRGVL